MAMPEYTPAPAPSKAEFDSLASDVSTLNGKIGNIGNSFTWANAVANCKLIIVTATYRDTFNIGMSIIIPVALLSNNSRYWQVSDAYNGGTDTHFQVTASVSNFDAKVFVGSTEKTDVTITIYGI